MIRSLALGALVCIAAPAVAGLPSASGTAVLMPAGAHASGVSGSFTMPVSHTDEPVSAIQGQTGKTGNQADCL